MNNNNNHQWLDGTLVSSGYSNWYSPYEPNNESYMDIYMNPDAHRGKWFDSDGSSKKFICEPGLV